VYGYPQPTSPQLNALAAEGVVFDREGNGYISEGERIVQFQLDGKSKTWATTGAPNGHKILSDGTHLVCDASRHAVLHLTAAGEKQEILLRFELSRSIAKDWLDRWLGPVVIK
jgi:hypothetical protein